MMDKAKIQKALNLIKGLGADVTVQCDPYRCYAVDADDLCLMAQSDGVYRVAAKHHGISFEQYMAWSVSSNGWSVFAHCCTATTAKGTMCGNRAIGHCIDPKEFKAGKHDRCRLHQEENAPFFIPTPEQVDAELKKFYPEPDEAEKAENKRLHAAGERLDQRCEACGFYLKFDGHCENCEDE